MKCYFCKDDLSLQYPYWYDPQRWLECANCKKLNDKVITSRTFITLNDQGKVVLDGHAIHLQGKSNKDYIWRLDLYPKQTRLWIGDQQRNPALYFCNVHPSFNIHNIMDKTKTYLLFS